MTRTGSRGPKSIGAILITLIIGLITAYFQGFSREAPRNPRPPIAKTEPAHKGNAPDDRSLSNKPPVRPSSTKQDRNEPRPADNDRTLERIKGFVSFVKDGDSLVLRVGNEEKEVRLWGIDSPEGNTRQPFAEDARAYARQLAHRKNITLAVHDRDQYGRLVGEAFLPDQSSLNEQMIRAGWAWHFRRHAAEKTSFARAEEDARQEGRGLWQDANPIPPWDWRRDHRPKE
ncbi:thermonuclease family protein [bacterium]|jgi:micrococcal nuclease|nr:thermonuclease family protein [bacterium]